MKKTVHGMACWQFSLGLTRIALGWLLLWGFIDKLFGLGFSTAVDKSWLAGGSPTLGFLKFGTSGPFAGLYQGMAGHPVVDGLFMAGLLLIGLALLLGIGVRIAGYSGALLFMLMWSAALLPEHNPLIDEHVIYALLLVAFAQGQAGDWIGFGRWWGSTGLVKKYGFLK